jgi:hypothetical protein
MTAAIVVQTFRFGFLILLWLFIYAAFRVVKADLFGANPARVSAVPRRGAPPAKLGTRKGSKGLKGPRQLVVTGGSLTGTRITLGTRFWSGAPTIPPSCSPTTSPAPDTPG